MSRMRAIRWAMALAMAGWVWVQGLVSSPVQTQGVSMTGGFAMVGAERCPDCGRQDSGVRQMPGSTH